jgi:hypothetical protein
MATNDPLEFLDALSAPIGDLIASVGRGVAEAQQALDASTIENLRTIYEATDDDLLTALQSIGYRPTWYAIPEATGEMTVALAVAGHSVSTVSTPTGNTATQRRLKVYAAPVDATYSNKFDFSLQAASKVTFRIVPVPASVLADQLRVAPNVVGKTFDEAKALLTSLDIPFTVVLGPVAAAQVAATTRAAVTAAATEPIGTAIVVAQAPEPGTVLLQAQGVQLSFA